MRILIYTHNTMGLGHAAIASTLAQAIINHIPNASVLLVGGVNLEKLDWLPEGTDQLKLPSFKRYTQQGQLYTSPKLNGLNKEDLSKIRRDVLLATFRTYRPDAVIVDFFPRGKMNELIPALTEWRNAQPKGLLCFGLRGVIDSSDRAFTEALEPDDLASLKEYDVIWAYCDPIALNVSMLHPELNSLVQKIVYTGYLVRGQQLSKGAAQSYRTDLGIDNASVFILVSLGFGWMSENILPIVIKAVELLAGTQSIRCLILCGDHLTMEARKQIDEIQDHKPEIFLKSRFVRNPLPYMQAADVFIGRGGYNTLTDVIASGRPAIIIPSLAHGYEQQIHAESLARLGFCDVLAETDLSILDLVQALGRALKNWTPPNLIIETNGASKAALWLLQHIQNEGAKS